MTKNFFLIFVLTNLLYSCGHNSVTNKKSNISKTISTDIDKLSELIDLKLFRPTSVKFKYSLVVNSGQNERLSAPGPSDSFIEAVLFYDTTTFRRLISTCNPDMMQYIEPSYDSPNFKKENFNFNWLDKNVKEELLKSNTTYHGNFDKYFGTSLTSKLWLLDNKILITKTTN